jgi:hypothetical protein
MKSLHQQREDEGNATAPPLLSTFPSSAWLDGTVL